MSVSAASLLLLCAPDTVEGGLQVDNATTYKLSRGARVRDVFGSDDAVVHL